MRNSSKKTSSPKSIQTYATKLWVLEKPKKTPPPPRTTSKTKSTKTSPRKTHKKKPGKSAKNPTKSSTPLTYKTISILTSSIGQTTTKLLSPLILLFIFGPAAPLKSPSSTKPAKSATIFAQSPSVTTTNWPLETPWAKLKYSMSVKKRKSTTLMAIVAG